ncbi:MAG: ABC transporter permease [Christensenellales bacterium]|jgi:ribose/xylose/arabinose/galactoside ABC-type transport system permease subunit
MKTDVKKMEIKKVSRAEIYKKYGLVAFLVIIIIALSIVKPNFATYNNIMNVLRQISINGLLAIGMTYVILLAGIDLSLGSIVGFAGIVTAILAKNHEMTIVVPIVVGILAGGVIGLINGLLISYVRVPAFIQTLGMLSIARGLTYVMSNAKPVNGLSKDFLAMGSGYWFGVPIPVIILIIVFAIMLFILYKTKFGRYVYAIGGNEDAALVSGLKVRPLKVVVYAISGLLAGLAGVVLTSRVSAGLAVSGEGYELDAVAAAVIGGTSLMGGEGSLWGTALGFLLIGILNNGLDLLNVSSYYQLIVKGAIIILSVVLDVQTKKEAK